MNTSATKRFLTALSSAVKIERGQLYQLVQSAEANYYLRDIHSQHELGLVLLSFGYPFNQIGKYYESIYLYRTGQYEKARQLLENVADSAPARYRSKALLSLSAVAERIGHFEESLRLRLQGLSSAAADDPVTLIEIQRGIAAVRSVEGDHRAALRDLERLMPLAHVIGKSGHPAYVSFLNSYALELSESSRTEEAEQVANVIAASPLINRYPEWQETLAEVTSKPKSKSRSTVSISLPKVTKRRNPRVQAAIDFMNGNLHRRISLTELAAVANLSPSRFSNVFKSQTRLSPGEYLIRLRMEKARDLLTTSQLSIKEVMAAVGYDTRSNFVRHFRKYFDLSPSEYKKRGFTAMAAFQ